MLKEYDTLNDENIYVWDVYSSTTILFDIGMYTAPKKDLLKTSFLLEGWTNEIPPLNQKMSSLGISNLYKSLIDNENVCYIGDRSLEIVTDYLRATYDASTVYSIVGSIRENSIYKFSTNHLNVQASSVDGNIQGVKQVDDKYVIEFNISDDTINHAFCVLENVSTGQKHTYQAIKRDNGQEYVCIIPISEDIETENIKIEYTKDGVVYQLGG